MAQASTQPAEFTTSFDGKPFTNEIESPPPYQAGSTFKNGVIKFSGMFSCNGEVTDAETGNLLYTAKANKSLRTKIEFKAPGESSPIGSAKFHMTRVDFDIRGQTFSLKVANKLMTKATYTSPAFNGQTLMWKCKCHMKNIEYILVDDKDLPVAKFEIDGIWWNKRGSKLEIVESYANDQAKTEEIMAASSALVWYTMTVLWASIV